MKRKSGISDNHRLKARFERLKHEVAERDGAKLELVESHNRLLAVLDSLDAIVYVADMHTHEVLFVNEYVRRIFGEVTGKICWQSLQEGQTGPCSFCTNRYLLDEDGNPTGVHQWEFFNGKNGRWYDIRDRAIDWIGGGIVRLEIATDITDRKMTEEALRRLNRELRAVSDCNQILMRATDEQSLLNDICRIICEEAGYRMAWVGYAERDDARTIRPVAAAGYEDGYIEQSGLTWADTQEGHSPEGMAIRSGNMVYVQDVATDERVAFGRDSALRRGYHSCVALPLKDEDGKVFGVLMVYSAEVNPIMKDEVRLLEELAGDLSFGISVLRARTARKEAERKLTLMGFALDRVSEAAFLVDERARFQYVNGEACRALGYRCDELLSMVVGDIAPDLTAEKWPGHWEVLKSRGSLIFEAAYRARDGRIFPVEVNANYVEYEGQGYSMALVRDIAERKAAEDRMRELTAGLEKRVSDRTSELRESQLALMNIVEDLNIKTEELRQANVKLQELDRLKSMFIASMSHELRTPLNSIIGFSSIMLDEWTGPVTKEQKENLAAILRAGKHLLALINDVIDVSKIESGKIEVSYEDFDLFDVMGEALELFRKDLGDKGLELRVELIHLILHSDRRRLLQCIVNLVSNAVKFTEKGSINISTRKVVGGHGAGEGGSGGDYIEIAIEDTGIGIREEAIPSLFGAFVRVHSIKTMSVKGTGLGLYLTKKMVSEILKGEIKVRSEFGKGSCFTLEIPVSLGKVQDEEGAGSRRQ